MSKLPASKIDQFWPINAAIWRNETNEGTTFYSVTFQRVYKDKDGKLQNSDSFNADDLLLLGKVADRAHTEIVRLRAADRAAQVQQQSEPGEDG